MNTNILSCSRMLRLTKPILVALIMLYSTRSFAQLTIYTFQQSTQTYTPITGGTVLGGSSSDDESFVNPAAPLGGTSAQSGVGFPIGFNFTYNGFVFDRFGINNNGWIFLGQSALTPSVTNIANSSTPISASSVSTPPQLRNRIAAFARDLTAQTGSELRFETIGTAPNRTLVVQFTNYRRFNATGDNLNFQIRLGESNNNVSIVYGTMTVAASATVEVGLGGLNNSEFLNRTATTSWSTTTAGTTNSATMTISPTIFPASGTTFTYLGLSCYPPFGLTASNITATGFTIAWRNPRLAPQSYEAVATTNSSPPASGNAVSDTDINFSGAQSSTSYNVFVRSNCGTADGFSPWVGPFRVTTAGPIQSNGNGLWSNPATWANGAVPANANDVTVRPGDTVILDVTTSVLSLTLNGVMRVEASANRQLTVNGDVTVASTGGINFGTPTAGTSLRILDIKGAFSHAGSSSFNNGNAIISLSGTTAQTFSYSGTLTNNAVGQLLINNPAGVTLGSPLTIGFNLDLINGVFNTGTNLTFNATATATTASQTRRSPLGSIVGTPTFTSTTYNLFYVFFTGQTSSLVTEGPEMPTSRTINALTISNPAGLNLTGNLTLTAAANALVLTSGIINLPAGGKITCSNTGFAPTVGSATSFVNGAFEITISTTSASRNFPIGSVVNGVPSRAHVVIGGINTSSVSRTITVSPVGAPSGAGVAPVNSVMGPRAFRITSSGAIGTALTVALNWQAEDAALFASSLANIRVVQATALTGTWTARSTSATDGSLTGTGTRTTTALALTGGEFFAWGTIGTAELEIAGLAGPNMQAPCLSASESLRVIVRNSGGAAVNYGTTNVTLNARMTTPGGTVINLSPVVRNTGTLAAIGSDTLIFSNVLNMTEQGNYTFAIQMDSLAGQLRTNDTLQTVVRSHQIIARIVPPQVFTGGSTAMASVSSSERMRITEFTQFFGGTGQTPSYPAFVTSGTADPDLLEMTNLGSLPADLSGHRLDIYGTGARSYVFPQGTSIPPYAVAVIHVGSGEDQPQNNFYNTGGTNGAISSISQTGYVLRDVSGAIIDAVAANGFQFPASAGVSIADWSGVIPNASAGASLLSADANRAARWIVATAAAPQSMGTLNPGLVPDTATVTWSGPAGFASSTGNTVNLGARNNAGVETYSATIAYGACSKVSTANLTVLAPSAPDAGFTISADTALTGGVFTTVTLTDTSLFIPSSRRWTITPATHQYVNNTNDTVSSPRVQFLAPGMYSIRLIASNAFGSDTLVRSNAINVRVEYCPSNAINTSDTKIDSVIIGAVTTGSALTACETYTNYTQLGSVGTITQLQPFNISIKNGACGTSIFSARGKVFVDVNKNGVFEANETFANFGTSTPVTKQWMNAQLVLPASIDTGLTRLRIVLVETSDSNLVNGCGTYSWGETEDYLVRIEKPANYSAVTFRVNMNKYPVSPQGVHIAGEFQGWNPGGSPMQTNGNGIYERTFLVATGDTVEYKFINGNSWGRDEQNWLLPCGVNNGFGSYNRQFVMPNTDVVLPAVFFNSCADQLNQLSLADLQYLPDYLVVDTPRNQRSRYQRDTVTVEGIVAAAPGQSVLSTSWRGSYIQLDIPAGGPGLLKGWTGINVRILHLADTVHFVPGNKVRVRGVVAEFPDSASFSQTQLDIPAGNNVSVLSTGNPVVFHRAFVGEMRYWIGGSNYITNFSGEKYEGTYVEMRQLTVASITPFGTGRFDITFEDQFGNRIVTRDESRVLRAPYFSTTDTTAPLYLAVGDRVRVRGFITSFTSGSINEFRIAPWNNGDIVKTGPIRIEASLRSRSTTSAVIAASHDFEEFFGTMGVVYSTTPNPTTASNNYWDAEASNNLLARLDGLLQPGTTYYARAYMMSQNGLFVQYSNEIVINTFTGPQPQPIVPILSVRKPASLAGTRLSGYAAFNAGWGFSYDTLSVEAPLIVGRSAISDSLGCDTSLVNAAAVKGKVVVLYRGTCGFSLKALAAVRAGAVGILMINNAPGTINMGSGPESLEIDIPIMMISDADGAQLRPFIDNGEAVVLMGNKNGQFGFDISLLQGETVGPDATSILSAMVSQPGQYITPVGAYVLNSGIQATSQFYLQVTVLKDVPGQAPQSVYNGFQQLAPNTQPGQSSYLSVPSIDWGAPAFGPGNYTIRYIAMPWSGLTDGFLDDNVIERRFSINDSLYAKTRLDSNGNLVLTGAGTRFGGIGSWTGANWFEYQGTVNRKVNAMRFAFTVNPGQSLAGETVEAQVHEWVDLDNDTLIDLGEVTQIGSGFYAYMTNAANQQVEVPMEDYNTGLPGVVIQPGKKYLFAVQYNGVNQGIFLATDPGVNYTGNLRNTGRWVSAVNNGSDWFSPGFGPQTVFAISAVIGNAAPPATPIVGMVRYNNATNTPMSNTEVMLYQQQTMLLQTTTDAAGMFDFGTVAPGSYTIRANTNKPWGGVNSTDALAIARHFTGAAPLAGLRLEVADVNASETVNATDALQVARRFTNQINSFVLGDWIFKADGFSHTNTQPTTVNVAALAVGDVNGSYNPANNRRMPLIAIEEAGSVRVGSEGSWITAHLVQALELGAVSLELQLPQGVEVQQVKSRLAGGDFTWQVKAGVLYLSWYSLNPVNATENAPVVDLLVRQTDEVGGSWSAGGESELANGWAEVHGPAQLRLPRLVDGSKGLFAAAAYPNPTRDASTLSLNLPATGKVSIRITDALGRVVFENAQEQAGGDHQLKLPTERWTAGTYQITVLYEGDTTEVQQLRLQIVR